MAKQAAKRFKGAPEIEAGLHLLVEPFADQLKNYVLLGWPQGSFLTACIENDLLHAISHADAAALSALKGIVQFLYNYCPGPCWGSREKRLAWQAKRGAQSDG